MQNHILSDNFNLKGIKDIIEEGGIRQEDIFKIIRNQNLKNTFNPISLTTNLAYHILHSNSSSNINSQRNGNGNEGVFDSNLFMNNMENTTNKEKAKEKETKEKEKAKEKEKEESNKKRRNQKK